MVMTSFGKGLAIKEVNGINCTRVGKAICVVYSGTIQKSSKRRCEYFSEGLKNWPEKQNVF